MLQPRLTRQGWTTVVNGMVGSGLRVSDEQKEAVVGYLSLYVGKLPGSPAQVSQPGARTAAPGTAAYEEPTATPNKGGSLSTAGDLMLIGSTLEKFRAFHARTGGRLWSYRLDGVALSTPISYLGTDGKQYVAIASGALSAGLLRTLHNAASNSPEKIFVFALEHQ